ncbi:hypothetical protein Landi51_07190 [Colletotrichum acutatum]
MGAAFAIRTLRGVLKTDTRMETGRKEPGRDAGRGRGPFSRIAVPFLSNLTLSRMLRNLPSPAKRKVTLAGSVASGFIPQAGHARPIQVLPASRPPKRVV